MPGEITHEKLINETNVACSLIYQFEKTHLEILKKANKLGAVLIQLPPFFREEHTDKLIQLLSSFSTRDYKVFVEVREKGLYLNADFESSINRESAAMVSIDSPEVQLDQNFHNSSHLKYVRLHGRNHSTWWKRNTDRNARYDYEYSSGELKKLTNTILSKTASGDEIFIYFNNHPAGQAPRNASSMLELMGSKPIGNRQDTLI